jgi:hypothetical protein
MKRAATSSKSLDTSIKPKIYVILNLNGSCNFEIDITNIPFLDFSKLVGNRIYEA